jgi:hypothetical protein
MIDHLTPMTPDAARRARTMARCHQRLAAGRRRIEARRRGRQPRAVMVERYLLAGVCAAYLIAMAGELVAVAAMR